MSLESLSPDIVYAVPILKKKLKRLGYKKIQEEVPPIFIENQRWRPTLTAILNSTYATFDVRADFKLEPSSFFSYIHNCQLERKEVEIWLAVTLDKDADFQLSFDFLKEIKKNGLGLIVIRPSFMDFIANAIPCNLQYNFADNDIAAGEYTERNKKARNKFSEGKLDDAIKDLSETFELAVRRLGSHAVATGKITQKNFKKDKLHNCIGYLGDVNLLTASGVAILLEVEKNDCIAFKGTRNLAHHPRETKAEELSFYSEVLERMMTGFRLVRLLWQRKTSL